MRTDSTILVVSLGNHRYGFWLSVVESVLPLVAITPLPGAPEVVLGVIVVRGATVPVVDLRRRFGLASPEPELNAQLVLAETARRRLAVLVDRVDGVEASETVETTVEAPSVPAEYISGVVRRADGLILIHDLDTVLGLGEERALDRALEQPGAPA